MSEKYQNICNNIRNYLESNELYDYERPIDYGTNFYAKSGSQGAVVSVFRTGTIRITSKENSQQLKETLYQLKHNIDTDKGESICDPEILLLLLQAADSFKSGNIQETFLMLTTASEKIQNIMTTA
jgi:hypothetical protein